MSAESTRAQGQRPLRRISSEGGPSRFVGQPAHTKSSDSKYIPMHSAHPLCMDSGFITIQGPVSQKSRELFGPEKAFVKLRPAYSVKLVFSYVVKGIKVKITAKFRASRRLLFKDTKRVMSPDIRPKNFGTFEKQAPDSRHIWELSIRD